MASSWIVLHVGQAVGCDHCRDALVVARRHNFVRVYNLPSMPNIKMNVGSHALVVLGLLHDGSGVRVSALCNPNRIMLGGMPRYVSFRRWRRGWQRPDIQCALQLMALANETPEKVWLDWQEAIEG